MTIVEGSSGKAQEKKNFKLIAIGSVLCLFYVAIIFSYNPERSWYYFKQDCREIKIFFNYLTHCFLVLKPYFIHGYTGLILLVLSAYGLARWGYNYQDEIQVSKMEAFVVGFCWALFVGWIICRVLR